ncbi:hypothetical protein [Lysinibacillus sphaericus]|uniref:hypothetical protein n=1 Tax=Lysinibacillus sphaericus TaxID=1421 RepID=UPI0019102A4B|nr:hypothetical protein [Lysinibacillus sphaericus]QPA56107.1 hypothetical protein INQ53_08990 [Lysinibacillus sphaericus]
MIPAQVQVDIDEKEIRNYIQQQLDECIRETILFIDIEGLVRITNFSKRFLEDAILSDPRVKQHQRQRARKRFWFYEPTIAAIKDIVNDW